MKRRALLIAGPTASGKSAVALALAQRFGGTIVNADSMQVYRDMRVLTARPSDIEEAIAPHALFGAVDGAINHSVGLWVTDAKGARVRLADVLGGQWAIVHVGEPPVGSQAWAALGIPAIQVSERELIGWLRQRKAAAAVLRPDGFIYAAARSGEALPPPPAKPALRPARAKKP